MQISVLGPVEVSIGGSASDIPLACGRIPRTSPAPCLLRRCCSPACRPTADRRSPPTVAHVTRAKFSGDGLIASRVARGPSSLALTRTREQPGRAQSSSLGTRALPQLNITLHGSVPQGMAGHDDQQFRYEVHVRRAAARIEPVGELDLATVRSSKTSSPCAQRRASSNSRSTCARCPSSTRPACG